ncbi:hypothetical protein Tco_1177185 [Tanacetum coccineum]
MLGILQVDDVYVFVFSSFFIDLSWRDFQRASLDEYMGVWFHCEVADTVEVHSTAVMFLKELEERVESRRILVNHLEKVRGCPTYGWLKRLKENHVEDLEQLGIVNGLMARTYVAVRKRGIDVAQMYY